MFRLIIEMIRVREEKVRARNDACARFLSQVCCMNKEEVKLFANKHEVIDEGRSAAWKKQSTELLSELNARQMGKLRRAKDYRKLEKEVHLLNAAKLACDGKVREHNQLISDNHLCDYFAKRIDAFLAYHKQLFARHNEFVDPKEGQAWVMSVEAMQGEWEKLDAKRMSKTDNFYTVKGKFRIIADLKQRIQIQIQLHNNMVAEQRAKEAHALIGDVEGRQLDIQQLNAIVKKVHNHLVVAGAGSGKTTTVVGKIKYLLRSKQCRPEDILVLSFTNASASEMCQRICKETGEKIEASTFHKLGMNIITKVNGVTPRITQINLRKFIREQLLKNMLEEGYLGKLSQYLLYSRVNVKSEFEFETAEAYADYLKRNPPTTAKNELVKSYGEMEIANFLSQHGVMYLYEHPYEQDTRTDEYNQYYPDFYLPQYKIYIEYFGINQNGEVPAYFTGKKGKSASQSYRESIEWKRKLHAENGTVMIECFAYEKLDGTLREKLTQRLVEHGVQLQSKTAQELWKQVSGENDAVLDGLVELFETVINLLKSNDYTVDTVRKRAADSFNRNEIYELLSLLEPIYRAYEQQLKERDEIDFNDMINIATQHVVAGRFRNPYRYVIVDEYQDISKARFRLLRKLRESQDYDLFCVGDDWQSIYRFAGSDIGFILNFAHYWGPSEESKIETTYRFSQSLINISADFVMANPSQKRKAMMGQRDGDCFALGEVNGYTERYAVEFMLQRLKDLPRDSSVFFVGRYTLDSNILTDSGFFDVQYNNQTGFLDVHYGARPDLKMVFITAHRSKGLQADYVVIINNKAARLGFPSTIQDAPILDMLLEKTDDYPYAEERRLFYVALTRAKKKVFLLTVKNKESVFIEELRGRYGDQLQKEQFTCPICGGKLIRRTGKYGDFFGCSNYNSGQCKYTRKILNKKQE